MIAAAIGTTTHSATTALWAHPSGRAVATWMVAFSSLSTGTFCGSAITGVAFRVDEVVVVVVVVVVVTTTAAAARGTAVGTGATTTSDGAPIRTGMCTTGSVMQHGVLQTARMSWLVEIRGPRYVSRASSAQVSTATGWSALQSCA